MKNFEFTIRTALLMGVLGLIFVTIGGLLGGKAGMTAALVFALVTNLAAWWFSDKMVLATHGAKEAPANHAVRQMVDELCSSNGLPKPRVYVVDDAAPNAFATGRDPQNSAVAVTTGLLRVLEPREVRAVLAHEIGHIQNRDVLLSTLAACFASAVMMLAHFAQMAGGLFFHRSDSDGEDHSPNPLTLLLAAIFAPMAAGLVQAAVSRTREYAADEEGARLADDPEGLASALEKISDPAAHERHQREEAMPEMQPAFSHLYIVNHFSGHGVLGLFSTHPPVDRRIARLRRLSTIGAAGRAGAKK